LNLRVFTQSLVSLMSVLYVYECSFGAPTSASSVLFESPETVLGRRPQTESVEKRLRVGMCLSLGRRTERDGSEYWQEGAAASDTQTRASSRPGHSACMSSMCTCSSEQNEINNE
jgi:hypothetical protein